ncbi:hypothetical protein [Pseudomonas sp. GZD-222]|uniref:phage tail tube protein n=1 Tax=Pseudomonas sp. GZD-222 TaxID=3404805 RepID=UPI003BB7FC1E
MSHGFNSPDNTIGWIGNGGAMFELLDSNDEPVGGAVFVGQASSASVALSTDKVEMMDMTYGTLGVAQSKVIKSSGDFSMTLKSYNPDILAILLFGDLYKDAAVPGATASVKAFKQSNAIVPGIITTLTSATIRGEAEPLIEGQDYVVSDGSLYFPKTSAIQDGDVIDVVYEKAAVRRIEGFTNTGKNVRITFDGRNIAADDAPVKVVYHKVSLSPAAQRQLLSSDYADQEIKGTLLVSKAVTGAGLSKLFVEEHVTAA